MKYATNKNNLTSQKKLVKRTINFKNKSLKSVKSFFYIDYCGLLNTKYIYFASNANGLISRSLTLSKSENIFFNYFFIPVYDLNKSKNNSIFFILSDTGVNNGFVKQEYNIIKIDERDYSTLCYYFKNDSRCSNSNYLDIRFNKNELKIRVY
uniref:Uncharacterized protein n=1 Tax=Amorphochlora amoebiformis TaxID=1561963 RepID=A0A0H5BI53_9EUKA|nr:hypothetical protein [Amorphochlora amoebiformis]